MHFLNLKYFIFFLNHKKNTIQYINTSVLSIILKMNKKEVMDCCIEDKINYEFLSAIKKEYEV